MEADPTTPERHRRHVTDPQLRSRAHERLRAALGRWEGRSPRLARALSPVLDIVPRYRQDDLPTHAGALTYGAFLSIPPLLLLGISVIGYLVGDPQRQTQLTEAVIELVPGLKEAVADSIERAVEGRLSLGVIGLVGVLWAASGVAARIRHALGSVYRTGYAGMLGGRFRALALGLPLGIGFLAIAGAAGAVSSMGQSGSIGPLVELLGQLAVLVVATGFMVVFYGWLTPAPAAGSGRVGAHLRDHVPAAVVFSVGFAALQRLGVLYVDQVVTRSSALYGTIGAIFGLLAFLYLTAYLFLLAAELAQVLRVRRLGFDLPPVVLASPEPGGGSAAD
jgi:YihY family inner membrane protein